MTAFCYLVRSLKQYPLHHGCIGFALRFHEGSTIDVHRGRDVRVTHEFLLYAERRTSLVEPSAVAVTQRVPADGSLFFVNNVIHLPSEY